MQQKQQQDKNAQDQFQVQVEEIQQQYSCFEGKLFKIPQWKKTIATGCLIQIPTILHEIMHSQWFSHQHLYAAFFFLFSFQFLNFWTFLTLCFQDPGFIPKIKYQYQTDKQFMKIPKNQHINDHQEISYILSPKQQNHSSKLCSTCNNFQPPRASHCDECGICVQRFDHHYSFLGICIGKKNYKYFYVFLLSLLLLMITVKVMCIMILIGSEDDPPSFKRRLKIYPLSIVLIFFTTIGFIYVGRLVIMYTYLLAKDETYKQFVDEKWNNKVGSPQKNLNCWKNFIKVLLVGNNQNKKYKKQVYRIQYYEPSSSDPENQRKSKNIFRDSTESLYENRKNEQVVHEIQQKMAENNMNLPNLQSLQKIKK